MEIKRIVTGTLEENCYLLSEGDHLLVIDPGSDGSQIKEMMGDKTLEAVLLTHSHFDHIGALREITKRTTPIYKRSNLEEKSYSFGDVSFEVLFTPGHSKDSVSFYFEKENILFSGDFLFKETIGRCDLPGGNESEMKESLRKLTRFDDSTVVYPGHDESTTIGHERQHNPYLK